MKKLFLLLLCTPLLLAIGCESSDDQIYCTDEFVYGLHVTVLDAGNGQPMADGVTVTAVQGSYHEVLYNLTGLDSTFYGAGERIGSYTLTVAKDGYHTYTTPTPIGVPANVCHVVPQAVTISLQPE